MNTAEQIQAAIEHLSIALNLLDQVGADLTAAHVDGAIDCLRTELTGPSWQEILALDFEHLDRLVDDTYGKHRTNIAAIPHGKG